MTSYHSSTILREIVQYAIGLNKKTLQPNVWELAHGCFKDAVGCMIAGANERAVQIIKKYVRDQGGKGKASGIGIKDQLVSPEYAALINGISAHVLEFDDINNTTFGHPSVPVLPVVLALGESLRKTGEEVMLAYITGIEVYALMGRLVSPEHNARGWNSTESLGIFGAAAAAAKMLELEEEPFQNALGIAASEACGLKGNSGTMTKPFHAGRAAQKGIMAASLALLGMTANPWVLENVGGFADATADGNIHIENVRKSIQDHNSEFIDLGLTLKPWPVCRAAHHCIDAMLQIMGTEEFRGKEWERIDCFIPQKAKETLRYEIAENGMQGQFSLPYCIALILLYGKIELADVSEKKKIDPKITEIMKKIHVYSNGITVFDAHGTGNVVVSYSDGSKTERKVDFAKGDPKNPMTKTDQIQKLRSCMRENLDEGVHDKIIALLNDFVFIEDAGDLLRNINKYIKIVSI